MKKKHTEIGHVPKGTGKCPCIACNPVYKTKTVTQPKGWNWCKTYRDSKDNDKIHVQFVKLRK